MPYGIAQNGSAPEVSSELPSALMPAEGMNSSSLPDGPCVSDRKA